MEERIHQIVSRRCCFQPQYHPFAFPYTQDNFQDDSGRSRHNIAFLLMMMEHNVHPREFLLEDFQMNLAVSSSAHEI